jgi:tetratricopeptide (TPR) repeat protein
MKDIGRITFSMGAHILLKDIRLSYSCADNALLFSKKNGRDCYHFFDEIRSHNSCTRKIKREDSRNRSIWLVFAGFYDCDQVLHDKGRNFHRKRMGELKKDITRHLTGNESFYYKDALCITFTDLKKDQVEEIFRRIMEKFTGLNIIINSFPGITGLPHLFSDSWEAFLCHDLYSTKGRLSWFREDTYGIIGVRYFRRRRYNKAYIFFRRAYILNPVKENILNLCSCMIYLGKYISAEILLKRNSLEDTEHYYIDLSHILYKTQRLTEALELLKKGKRLYPDSGIIKNNYRELTCLLKD